MIFAAQKYGVAATGITLSRTQAEYGSSLIRKLGLEAQCTILHLDFRDFRCADRFDKIASVGAIEHVPEGELLSFFQNAKKLLEPSGLFLSHGITAAATDSLPSGQSFVDAFVFPDNGVTMIWQQLRTAE